MDKSIWVVAVVSKDISRGHRAQSFWDSKKKAIEEGIFGWACPGAVLSEHGYYDYVVVEELHLNHPIPFLANKQTWFKFLPHWEMVRCKTPARFKHTFGFW